MRKTDEVRNGLRKPLNLNQIGTADGNNIASHPKIEDHFPFAPYHSEVSIGPFSDFFKKPARKPVSDSRNINDLLDYIEGNKVSERKMLEKKMSEKKVAKKARQRIKKAQEREMQLKVEAQAKEKQKQDSENEHFNLFEETVSAIVTTNKLPKAGNSTSITITIKESSELLSVLLDKRDYTEQLATLIVTTDKTKSNLAIKIVFQANIDKEDDAEKSSQNKENDDEKANGNSKLFEKAKQSQLQAMIDSLRKKSAITITKIERPPSSTQDKSTVDTKKPNQITTSNKKQK